MSVWDRLVDADEAVAVLREAVAEADAEVRPETPPDGASRRVMTHAWLVTGPPGSGRSVAAGAFAAALQCPAQGCGHCTACRTALSGAHGDVTLVVPEGLSIGVDAARALVRTASLAPGEGRWTVVVVEDADRLTEQAANALLTVLEEPPPRTVVVLCAPGVGDVLPTLRSRCRVLALRTPRPGAVAGLLEAQGVDAGTAHWAARAAQGHVGRARRLATDPEARTARTEVLALAEAPGVPQALTAAADLVAAADAEAARLTEDRDAGEKEALTAALGAGGTTKGRARALPRGAKGEVTALEKQQRSRATRTGRDALDRALVDLAALYRDVLLRQVGADVEPVHTDVTARTDAIARRSTRADTLRRLEAVLACREAVAANAQPALAVEALAVGLLARPAR